MRDSFTILILSEFVSCQSSASEHTSMGPHYIKGFRKLNIILGCLRDRSLVLDICIRFDSLSSLLLIAMSSAEI